MPPSADTWHRVKELFDAALDLPSDERAAFLDRACIGNEALRAEVESLLESDEQESSFIDETAFAVARPRPGAAEDSAAFVGRHFGAYRVIRELGRGGLGIVYLAARADEQFQKEVAIKVVKRGLDTDDILRRFRAERQILAQLDHPNIARLLDAGSTEEGLPYFVMEYVDGQPIGEYCEENKLSTRERLQLFRLVCSAMTYAHQRLVIHRDIKPSNILVTREGVPKLLDFGIAKVLHSDDPLAAQTLTGVRVMTPEYASPEQVRGEPISTATDVYSLGVLLYELLTGRKPYRLTTHTAEELARAVADQVPDRPSTAVTSLVQDGEAKFEIQKSLRGDLDNIILMALRKEPERRYASVEQFSEDIRRHLHGLPVAAHKDTFAYRSGKFIQRHKLAVAAAVLLAITLSGGVAATVWQANRADRQRARAERRFDQVRALANAIVFELHGAIEKLPGSTAARELLVKRALQYLDTLSDESSDDPSLQRELASAYIKIGNAQGNPNNANLGDTAGALHSYREALTIAEQLVADDPDDPQSKRWLGVALEKMSEVQSVSGDIAAAVETARSSLRAFREIAEAKRGDAAARRSLAISYLKFGDVLGNPNFANAGDTAGALRNYHSAREILESLLRGAPDDFGLQRLTGVIHERLGTVLLRQGDIAGAQASYETSQRIRQELADRRPDNVEVVRDTAIAHEKIGDVLTRSGQLAAALESRRRSLAIFQRLAEADPQNVQAQQSLAISHMHLGDLLGHPDEPGLGRKDEAEIHYRAALDLMISAHGTEPTDGKARDTLEAIQTRLRKLANGPAP